MSRSRLLRPLLYTAGVGGIGSAVLYLSYRPRDLPGADGEGSRLALGKDGKVIPPRFPTIPRREKQWIRLSQAADRTEEYDLLVIGGGATGTGIALDAVTRGLKVALVEGDDFGSGTSSKSTKLVHGGVRYLEKAVWELDYSQFSLVREALRERKYFLHTAPHLSSWLPIMIPVQKWWQAPYFWLGTKFYDFLAGSEGIESSYFLTRSRAMDAFPMLRKESLWGALVYYGLCFRVWLADDSNGLFGTMLAHTTNDRRRSQRFADERGFGHDGCVVRSHGSQSCTSHQAREE